MRVRRRSALAFFLLSLLGLSCLMSACHPGMMHDLLNSRPEGPFQYDCSPRPEDPEGYMVKICEYLNENQIWVGQFHAFDIDEVIETEEEGRPIIIILLSCCGTGDRAAIDKETGEVRYYSKGVW